MSDTPHELSSRRVGLKNGKSIFTTGQVAKICQVAPRTVSKWFDSGRLEGYRVPGSNDRRVPKKNLLKFLREHKIPISNLLHDYWGAVLLVGLEKSLEGKVNSALKYRDVPVVEAASNALEAAFLPGGVVPVVAAIDLSVQQAVELARSLARFGCKNVALANEDTEEPGLLLEKGFHAILQKPCSAEEIAVQLVRLSEQN